MGTRKPKIIVVDDIMFHLLSIKERLKEHYDVFPAQTREKLFQHLSNITPDMIILDVNMPEEDGFETFEMLKYDTLYSGIPVVFLTGQKDKESLIKAMNLGASDYLMKPVSDTDLVECIAYHLDPAGKDSMKPVILAVDDNPAILKTLNALLARKYKVYSLPFPEKIKDLLSMVTPDLFILDCIMPIYSGFDLVPIIRSYSEHERTPIIFLTGDGTQENLMAAINIGASDFLVKPVNDVLLQEKVALHLKDFILNRRLNHLEKIM